MKIWIFQTSRTILEVASIVVAAKVLSSSNTSSLGLDQGSSNDLTLRDARIQSSSRIWRFQMRNLKSPTRTIRSSRSSIRPEPHVVVARI